ncbi:hypothetical protein HZH66_002425 [Vespula vulgaris]|uniref:Uncharacterized protein n=1 Tax=Vespula vulgaris TaxID=7454 RepID=A0A834KJU4_VESVU|nr:hypothetical protein HZH66_002425 [Vespula vulgaris]
MFISFHALSKVSKEVSTAEQVEVDPTLRIISYNHDSGYERPTLVNALNTREVAQARCLQSFEWRGRPKKNAPFKVDELAHNSRFFPQHSQGQLKQDDERKCLE